jgi:hypothetical protein
MKKEIFVEKNTVTGNFDITYKGKVYRTVFMDIHSNQFYISEYGDGFNNVGDAINMAIDLVKSEVL